ncbi:MAG TPA: ion transporter [Chloroflexota bacterium]|nr:ion transporter [Chloroflexota bacterium]
MESSKIPEDIDPQEAEQERDELLSRVSSWLDLPMAFLGLVWTGLLLFQLAVPTSQWLELIGRADLAIWGIFGLQFLVELALATNKVRYLRQNWLTAVSVVLPMFRIARLVVTLRAIRSLSVVSIVLRTNRATRAAANMFGQGQFHYVVAISTIIVLMSAAGVSFLEATEPESPLRSFGEALWWSATMITTVNVGVEPLSAEARILALLLRIFGVAVFGYITAQIASYLVDQRVRARTGSRENVSSREVTDLKHELTRLQVTIDALRQQMAEKGPRPGEARTGEPPQPSPVAKRRGIVHRIVAPVRKFLGPGS